MALASTVGAVAAGTAVAAYLEAKLHIKKDLSSLYGLRQNEKTFQKLAEQKRISLWYRFETQVERLPASEKCLWSRAGIYTWRETHEQSCRYAQFFTTQGLRYPDLIAFYLQNSLDFMFSTLGSWAIGSAPALINHNLNGEGLIHCLKVSGAKLLLVDGEDVCRKRIEEVRDSIEGSLGMRIIVLDQNTKAQINALDPIRPEDALREQCKPDFPMCLLYTSGSTGFPKACPFPLQRSGGIREQRTRSLGLKPGPNGDKFYDCMPLYHGTGFTAAVNCMTTGMTLCIGKKFSASRFWDDIRDSQATAFVYVGETARYLLAAPPSERDKDHKVRLMFGNGLRPDVWTRFSERFGITWIAEFFASTEGGFALQNVSRGPYLANAVGHHGAIIRTLMHSTYVPVEVDFDTGDIWRDPRTGFAKRRPYEAGGEILIKVPNEKAFVGYWNNPKATGERFARDVFKKGDLYYRTGDALRRTTDGRWFFVDRLGDTFRWKSENVSTAEVAEAIGHFPCVVEAQVYGVSVPGHEGRAGCAAIHVPPAARASFDFAALHAFARARLPGYAVPVFLRLVRELAPMHNNKQNKAPLKRQGIDLVRIEEEAKGAGGEPDGLMWCPAALGRGGRGEGYVRFTEADMRDLETATRGSVKL